MTSPWVVTTNTDRVGLDADRHGELTFTVTNSLSAADRVVFEPVPGPGVDPGALSVDNPSRQIPGGASSAFQVRVALGPQVPAGRYELYGQAYSAHLAPEETLGRSGRVVFEVPAPPTPKRRPWWLLAVAGLVVVVLVVVLSLALHGRSGPAPAAAPASVAAPATVAVPDVAGHAPADATALLTAAGLKAGTVKVRQDPDKAGLVSGQQPAAGTTVARGSAVDLVKSVSLLPPTTRAPLIGLTNTTGVEFHWDAVKDATAYQLTILRYACGIFGNLNGRCSYYPVLTKRFATNSAVLDLPLEQPNETKPAPVVKYQWRVAAVDSFDTVAAPAVSPEIPVTQ
jgi:hypothetical protein